MGKNDFLDPILFPYDLVVKKAKKETLSTGGREGGGRGGRKFIDILSDFPSLKNSYNSWL